MKLEIRELHQLYGSQLVLIFRWNVMKINVVEIV